MALNKFMGVLFNSNNFWWHPITAAVFAKYLIDFVFEDMAHYDLRLKNINFGISRKRRVSSKRYLCTSLDSP